MSLYYEDEYVQLHHGDCRAIRGWTTADVLVTDPPYGYAHASNRKGKFKGEVIANDSSLDARDEVLTLWGDRPALVFGTWKMPKPAGTRAVLVWDKGEASGMGDLSIPWKPNWEEVYVLGRGFTGSRDGGVLRSQVVTWATAGREHPNMKPTALMEALIAKCPPGVIADPFAGSGSTLLAARNLGRRVIGVEVDERYCETIVKRLSQQAFDFSALGVS